jgi:MscS family membrane protein
MVNRKSDFPSLRNPNPLHHLASFKLEIGRHQKPSGNLSAIPWLAPLRTCLRLAGWSVVSALLALTPAQPAHSIEAKSPLAPLDTRNPKTTLTGFLTNMDEALRLTRDEFLNSWTTDDHAGARVKALFAKAYRTFDLSRVPPEARLEVSGDAALHLYDVLARIELPAESAMPGAEAFEEGKKNQRWIIPGTEITLARVNEGPRAGEFLFSPETVERAKEFYDRTKYLPILRDVPLTNIVERQANLGGFLLHPHLIEQFPDWTKQLVLGQGLWKWITIAVVIVVGLTVIFGIHRLARAKLSGHSVGTQLRRLLTPILVLLLMQFLILLINFGLLARGVLAEGIILAATAVSYFAGAWAAWLAAVTIAELLISSPKIPDQGLDANMLRLGARVVGIFSAVALMFHGASQIGLPFYGVIASVGVGGVAVALAARNTLEDFLGSINLYLDRPARVGDFCRYGEDPSSGWLRIGTIESIGLRSTKIRGIDRTVTTIPNSDFARLHIVNMSVRDRILLKADLHLRYDTTPGLLQVVLKNLRALLHDHPRVTDDPARVRFVGFGDYSLVLEIFAYIDTSDINDYLACQEDLNLRIMRIVEDAGTSLALPSRTLYHTQDSRGGGNPWKTADA